MALSMLQLDADPLRSNSAPPAGTGITRPKFNSMLTSDRLRVGASPPGTTTRPFIRTGSSIRKGRKSMFRELGLDDDLSSPGGLDSPLSASPVDVTPGVSQAQSDVDRDLMLAAGDENLFGRLTGLVSGVSYNNNNNPMRAPPTPSQQGTAALYDEKSRISYSTHQQHPTTYSQNHHPEPSPTEGDSSRSRPRVIEPTTRPWYVRLPVVGGIVAGVESGDGRPLVRTAATAPAPTALYRFTMLALLIAIMVPGLGLHHGRAGSSKMADAGPVLVPRERSPTEICTRWAQQVASLNGTLYIYGGQTKDEAGQDTDTWNNRFLTLDLTKDWGISKPSLRGLEMPDGPPKVSLGYLWNDYNNLYLYGGQFADSPYAEPTRESIWRYSIRDSSWTEMRDPTTSDGKFADAGGQPVHRAAEGAGLSVPELGLSWYFGGHLDWATTPGWSRQVDRVYLKSMIEFTHPGYSNDMVTGLRNSGAPDKGAFRNITQGGLQADTDEAFPERADGALVFVPGWGESGVLLGLAGGTNDTFTHDLSTLDVYDIATSEWYHQETTGEAPGVRVNLCATVASAKDASSFQVYVFGGQNLIPFGEQVQYNDMYVLSIPSFTWHKVDHQDQEHVPSPRAGHTCTMRDGQMVVVGGYVGQKIACDSPGFYVFDASTLAWTDGFKAGDHDDNYSPENSVQAGSHGYQVPMPVADVIGGDGDGTATLSTPVAGATGGPFATGKPPVYTVTRSGHTATITSFPESTGGIGGSNGGSDGGGVNGGLIAAGILAGLFGLLAGYLGFCLYLYRRQVSAYQQHLAVANRYSVRSESGLMLGAAGPGARGRSSRAHRRDGSLSSDNSFGWLGGAVEPKWISEETTPGSATTGGSGSGSGGSGSGGAGAGMVGNSGGKWRSDDRRGEYSNVTNLREDGERPDTRSSNGDGGSVSSTERLLEGHEPSFFSVVMGPRRALRVVNGAD